MLNKGFVSASLAKAIRPISRRNPRKARLKKEKEIPFPLYPETSRGSPNRGGIGDLLVEFSFVRRQPATRLTMTIARAPTTGETIGNPNVLYQRSAYLVLLIQSCRELLVRSIILSRSYNRLYLVDREPAFSPLVHSNPDENRLSSVRSRAISRLSDFGYFAGQPYLSRFYKM